MNERELFIASLQIEDPSLRLSYLEEECGHDSELRQRVTSLLKAFGQAGSFLQHPAVEPVVTIDQVRTDCPGLQIGPYKLLEQIGEGGMGTVYVAEQKEPVRRKVALKLIKPGMDSHQVVARFEAERQALALMNHPNIARVLDAGTTETGRPYFAMELVKGTPITEFCDQQKLDTRERLQLFITVCQAVQHAHQKGLIHRDLKPSNVLVEIHDVKPVPKVIDFGVAKAIGQQLTEKTLHTGFSQMIGTPLYMSPEQAGLSSIDIDTRSDIYSLGVLLYEILTGQTPFESETLRKAGFDEMRRLISEVDPPRPSARISTLEAQALSTVSNSRKIDPHKLSRQLRGELDWIVMKALEKDRDRRYETANGFAADVQRYLNDEAVSACPPSAAYRFRKFVRRNKVALTTVLLVTSALVVGTLVSAWQAVRATNAEGLAQTRLEETEEARKDAVANLQKAREAVDRMLTRVAEEKLAYSPELEEMRIQVFQDALEFYEKFLAMNPGDLQIRGETGFIHTRLGQTLAIHGYLKKSADSLSRAELLLRPVVEREPLQPKFGLALQDALHSLGFYYRGTDKSEDAIWVHAEALAIAERLVQSYPHEPIHYQRLARAQTVMGWTLDSAPGKREAARKMFGQGFDTAKAFAKQHPDSPLAQGELGLSSHVLGSQMIADRRYQEAESSLIDATRLLEKVAYKTPHEYGYRDMLAAATTELGDLMRLTGRPEEAKEWYHRAENHWRKLVSDYPLRGYRFGLIGFLFARDRNDDAIKVLDDGVMVTQEAMRSHPEDPVLRGIHEKFCNSLAWHLVTAPSTQLHNPSKALALAEKAVKLAPNSGGNWNTLGIVQYRKGEWKAAADSLGKSMELRKGGDSSDWFFQAMVHWQLGDQDEARKWYDQAVGWMEKNAPDDEELRSIRAEAAELFGVK